MTSLPLFALCSPRAGSNPFLSAFPRRGTDFATLSCCGELLTDTNRPTNSSQDLRNCNQESRRGKPAWQKQNVWDHCISLLWVHVHPFCQPAHVHLVSERFSEDSLMAFWPLYLQRWLQVSLGKAPSDTSDVIRFTRQSVEIQNRFKAHHRQTEKNASFFFWSL